MTQTIAVDPVTRIEGHAKVTIDLDDKGEVAFAGLIINELRGFERILVGMAADKLPTVTGRICGVCPSAHHLASVKALENAIGAVPPPAAQLQRELLYMGHFIHSHAVHLFALVGPDLLFGIDEAPSKRNIVKMVEEAPDTAEKALRLRSLGQRINEIIGGRGVHPVTAVVGGMSVPLTVEKQKQLRAMSGEALRLTLELAETSQTLLQKQLDTHPDLLERIALPTAYLGTVKNDIHDFGKDIVATIMSSNGIQVIDLGVNVEHQAFVDAIKESGATLVGMSCLLTTVFDDMRATVQAIGNVGLRDQVTILIGGGPVDQDTADYVGADFYCKTAQDGVVAAKQVLGVS